MTTYIYVVEKILGRTGEEHPREILDAQATVARLNPGNAIVHVLRLANYRARRAVARLPGRGGETAHADLAPFSGHNGQGIEHTAGLLARGYVVEVALIQGPEYPLVRARRQVCPDEPAVEPVTYIPAEEAT